MAKRVVLGVCILLVAVGGSFLHSGECSRIRAEAAREAVPIRLPVDLSRPALYRGQYRKTYAGNHADYLRLETQPPFQGKAEMSEALVGFSGQIVITNELGEVVQDSKLAPMDLVEPDRWTWSLEAVELRIWQVGSYILEFRVIQPAQAMSGRAQCVVGGYGFCGLEFLPATILQTAGVACWIVAGLIYGCYLPAIWTAAGPKSASPDKSPATASTA